MFDPHLAATRLPFRFWRFLSKISSSTLRARPAAKKPEKKPLMAAENSQMLKLAGGMAVGATALMMASALKQSLNLGLR